MVNEKKQCEKNEKNRGTPYGSPLMLVALWFLTPSIACRNPWLVYECCGPRRPELCALLVRRSDRQDNRTKHGIQKFVITGGRCLGSWTFESFRIANPIFSRDSSRDCDREIRFVRFRPHTVASSEKTINHCPSFFWRRTFAASLPPIYFTFLPSPARGQFGSVINTDYWWPPSLVGGKLGAVLDLVCFRR